MSSINIENWKRVMEGGDMAGLRDLLADNVTFISPVVHTPQQGKAITFAYLAAAHEVLGGDDFRYLREFDCGSRAVLEFATVIDGLTINGVDMIEWDEAGKITEFKVMVRPLKAINAVHQAMGAVLMRMQAAAG